MPLSDVYDIDFYKVGRWLLPNNLRNTKRVIVLQAMLNPLLFVIDNFSRYRTAKLYQLKITTQVCYLEMMLNDRYDFTLRRIVITDSQWQSAFYIFTEDELKPQSLFKDSENEPVFLYSDNEAGTVKDDFVVEVPADIIFNEDEMSSLIDAYKLFGTHYKIVLI